MLKHDNFHHVLGPTWVQEREGPGNALYGREKGRDKRLLETAKVDFSATVVPVTEGFEINLQLGQQDSLGIVCPWLTFSWFLGFSGDYMFQCEILNKFIV